MEPAMDRRSVRLPVRAVDRVLGGADSMYRPTALVSFHSPLYGTVGAPAPLRLLVVKYSRWKLSENAGVASALGCGSSSGALNSESGACLAG